MHRVFLEDTQETGHRVYLWGGDPLARGQKEEEVCVHVTLFTFSRTKKVYYLFRKINTNKRTRLAPPLWVLEESKSTLL